MIKVNGQGIIYKKEVKSNRNGSYWVRLTLRVSKDRGNNFYNVSYSTDSESEVNTLREGDKVNVLGTWEISRVKQRDGVPVSYNFIKAEEINKLNNGDEPW